MKLLYKTLLMKEKRAIDINKETPLAPVEDGVELLSCSAVHFK